MWNTFWMCTKANMEEKQEGAGWKGRKVAIITLLIWISVVFVIDLTVLWKRLFNKCLLIHYLKFIFLVEFFDINTEKIFLNLNSLFFCFNISKIDYLPLMLLCKKLYINTLQILCGVVFLRFHRFQFICVFFLSCCDVVVGLCYILSMTIPRS